jgi:hypothetical protein
MYRTVTSSPKTSITKTDMWCRAHVQMHPRSAFAPSFIKRLDFRCRTAFKAAYAGRYAKPKARKAKKQPRRSSVDMF